jgi:hypothetical protein
LNHGCTRMNTDKKEVKILELHWFFKCENHEDAASKIRALADAIESASVPDKNGRVQTGTDSGCDTLKNRKTWLLYPSPIRVHPCSSVVHFSSLSTLTPGTH